MSVVKDKKLGRFFRATEFRCRCRRLDCDAPAVEPGFVGKLEALRETWGRPLRVTSGVRCSYWNDKVHGSPKSQHLLGNAVDFYVEDRNEALALAALAVKTGLGGIGVASTFIHLDDGAPGRRWEYDSSGGVVKAGRWAL